MRVEVMSKMRGVDSFGKLWKRRTVIALPDGTKCDLPSVPDLVQAKKTQRDKDWLMIRRLVEAQDSAFDGLTCARRRPTLATLDYENFGL